MASLVKHYHFKFVAALAVVATCAFVLGGCGGSGGPTFKTREVKGTVKFKGQPLADADVQYHLQGTRPEGYVGSAGKTDANGNYEIYTNAQKGAIEGQYKVTVSKYTDPKGGPLKIDEASGMDKEQLIMQGMAVESIPKAYSDQNETKLSTEVAAGKTEPHVFDIEIP